MSFTPQGLLPEIPALSFAEFSGDFHRRAARERIPVGAMLELTYRCNFDCVHCYVVQPSARGELATREVLRILRELRDVGALFLTLTGGEILTRPDFEAIYLAAKELGFVVSLFTNAALIKERTLALFQRYPPHKVEVTLYGAGEETYRAVTRRRNMHRLVLQNVDRMRELGIDVFLKGVGLDLNRDELPGILEEARQRGVEGHFKYDNQITVRTDCRRGPADHRLSAAEVVAQDREDPRRIEEFRRLYQRNRGRRFLSDRLFRCGAGTSQLVIDPFGKLQTCALYRQEWFDLREGSVADGWAYLQRIVAQPLGHPTRCRSCDKVSLCGSCPGNNALESGGDPQAPPDYLCEITYARVEAFMADLRPRVPEPAGRWLPLHRAQDCQRPWLQVREPIGELIRPTPSARPWGGRALPIAS